MSDPGTLHVTVRLHAILRHRDGKIVNQLSLDLLPGSRVRDALDALQFPAQVGLIPARNGQVVAEDDLLADGDQLAVMPEIGGG
jgi:sulfur carrier protein ThiS